MFIRLTSGGRVTVRVSSDGIVKCDARDGAGLSEGPAAASQNLAEEAGMHTGAVCETSLCLGTHPAISRVAVLH
jgi:hypothetical protein